MKGHFHVLQARILSVARAKLQDGHFTERGLARHLGVSQPHIHNVLCGVRPVTPQLLEIMLDGFQLSLLDLFTGDELRQHLQSRARRHGD
jgi:transcriptional regulator with XRE-family HTH domain